MNELTDNRGEESTLQLRYYPDPILRRPCAPVQEVTEEIKTFARSMLRTLEAEGGVGLAAPQVGTSIRMFVVDIWWPKSGTWDRSLTFINPVIVEAAGKQREQEGCLSIPNVFEYIERKQSILVQALGLDGTSFSLEAQGYLAVAIQHEMDHLDGVTFLDRMGPLTRRMALKNLRK